MLWYLILGFCRLLGSSEGQKRVQSRKFGQYFAADVWLRLQSWILVKILNLGLMLNRDSKIDVWSRFVWNLWYELNPRVRCAFGNVYARSQIQQLVTPGQHVNSVCRWVWYRFLSLILPLKTKSKQKISLLFLGKCQQYLQSLLTWLPVYLLLSKAHSSSVQV